MRPPKKAPPTLAQLKAELKRERHRRTYGLTLRSTIYSLITVAAVRCWWQRCFCLCFRFTAPA